jgi:hypothetical protein
MEASSIARLVNMTIVLPDLSEAEQAKRFVPGFFFGAYGGGILGSVALSGGARKPDLRNGAIAHARKAAADPKSLYKNRPRCAFVNKARPRLVAFEPDARP